MTTWQSVYIFCKLGAVDIANESQLPDSDRLPAMPNYVPTPNNPPWNIWVAIGVWLLSVGFVVFVPLVFVTPYAISQRLDLSDRAALRDFMLTDPTAIVLQLAPIILAHALTLVVAWFVVTRFNTFSFRETLGWRMGGFRAWHGIAITVFFYVLAVLLTLAFGDVENEFEVLIKSSRYAVYLVAFFATVTAPLVEEVIYRGLLYSAFQRRVGAAIAVVLVTLLFTGVHVPQYSVGATPDYATVITLTLLSLTLTLLRAWSGNLLPCIVLHTIFNGIQSVLLLLEPYIRSVEPIVEPAGIFTFLK